MYSEEGDSFSADPGPPEGVTWGHCPLPARPRLRDTSSFPHTASSSQPNSRPGPSALCRGRAAAPTWWPGRRGGGSDGLPQGGRSHALITEAADSTRGPSTATPCTVSHFPGPWAQSCHPVGNRLQNRGALFSTRQSTLQSCLQQRST